MNNKTKNLEIKSLSKRILEKVVGYIALLVGFVICRYFRVQVTVFLLFVIPIIIGLLLPNWYMKRAKISTTLIKCVVWSNVLTWLIPPLGVFTGVSAIQFGNYVINQKIKYTILGVFAIALALVGAASGIFLQPS